MTVETTNTTESERTCVVCRAVREPGELLPLAWAGDSLIVATGRGRERRAYVCVAPACLAGLMAKDLGRSLKQPVGAIDAAAFLSLVRAVAEQRIHEHIGLSRRAGELEVGTDRVFETEAGTVVIVAADVAERTLMAARRADAWIFSTIEQLGRAAGMGRVGALRLPRGRLAAQAAYWLGVWRACAKDEVA